MRAIALAVILGLMTTDVIAFEGAWKWAVFAISVSLAMRWTSSIRHWEW
jgi:hypothetical protein